MWLPYRSLLVYLIGSALMMGLFLFFAYGIGWPHGVDDCVNKTPNECYCEYFTRSDITNGVKGVRQGVNTWSNLYAFATAGVVLAFMWYDRAKTPDNPVVIRSKSWVADAYVFAVLFLGLGSMWLHASLAKAVSWMDGLSMYIFAGYLVFYTLDRYLRQAPENKPGPRATERTRTLVFWIGYPATAIVFTLIGVAGVPSPALIFLLVAIYAWLEFFMAKFIATFWAVTFWLIGLFAMENAIVFWKMSQTGATMCDTTEKMKAFFQPHGLLWHPLAGVMAVMMYFYWRCEPAVRPRNMDPPLQRWA